MSNGVDSSSAKNNGEQLLWWCHAVTLVALVQQYTDNTKHVFTRSASRRCEFGFIYPRGGGISVIRCALQKHVVVRLKENIWLIKIYNRCDT